MEVIGQSLPKDAANPRAFTRRDLTSLLRSFEVVIDHWNRTHPNHFPIFFADEAQALAGMLRRTGMIYQTPLKMGRYFLMRDAKGVKLPHLFEVFFCCPAHSHRL